MRRLIHLLVLVLALIALPAGVVAQATEGESDGFLLRANGDVTVAPGETMGSVIVINGDAMVEGAITDTLWVISGDATVNGSVGGDVMVIDGTLTLAQGSTVENVMLVRGTLDRAEGATVTGNISERAELISLGWGATVFSMMMWLGLTLALIAAAMLFVRFGGRQLAASGEVLRHRTGMAAVTALALWIGLPIVAVLAFITVIGIPLGGAIILFLLPALWLLGYLVASAKAGAMVLHALGITADRPHQAYMAAGLGVVLFQLVGLVPALGPLVVLLAALAGSGALIYRLVERPREHRPVASHQPHPQPAG
jgi:hypothetical protein